MEGPASPKRAKTQTEAGSDVPELEEEEQDVEAEADAVLEQDLRNAQALLDKENEELLDKIRQLEHEFNIRKSPLYKSRGKVIRQIPGFWLHCFMQHEEIKLVLGAVDQDILSNVTELEVEPFQDVKSGYRLILQFAENEFFSDKELVKDINFKQEPGQLIQCTVSGCSPAWKTDDPTKPETIKTGRKRGRDSITFFRWFTQPNEFEPGLIDTLAEIIKDQLWVNPLEFMDAEEDGDDPVILDDDDDDDEEEEEDDEDAEDAEDGSELGANAVDWGLENQGLPEGAEEPDLADYEDEETPVPPS